MFVKLVHLVLLLRLTIALEEVSVTIKQGTLVGEWRETFNGKEYAAFEGIPYAKPPVGSRRFEAPQPAKPWIGIWQAKKLPNMCLQWGDLDGISEYVVEGDEDCLYLNVYSKNPSENENLDVVVYIHGGAFIFGSSVLYTPKYLLDENILLVTINYRLGPLGFLSTQDDVVPGNNGLKDQVLALKWIRDNIKHFGGNPNSITAMGMSAGGASVNYHMVSPMSRGLIHKAISESGSVCNPWTMQTRPKEKALQIGAFLGCPTTSTDVLVKCLKKRPASTIVKTVPQFAPFLQGPFSPFAPVVEASTVKDAFITKHPYKIIEEGGMEDIPWILSVTSEEGLYPVGLYIKNPKLLDDMNKRWKEVAPHLLDFNDTIPLNKHDIVGQKIREAYMKGKDISLSTISDLIDMCSDRHFINGIEECAKLAASKKKKPLYFYRFSYAGEYSLSDFLTGKEEKYGVSHGDDTSYIIYMSFFKVIKSEEDKKMSNIMIKMVSSFTKTGVPEIDNEIWLPLNENRNSMNVLQIKSPSDIKLEQQKTVVYNDIWEEFKFKENYNFYDKKVKSEL